MWAIIKKEFKTYFLSPIGYMYIGMFLLVYSMVFYNYIFVMQSTTLSYIFSYWVILIITPIMIALLTMRAFAEERKTGTEQLLMTAPKSVTQIVLGKFFAAALVVLLSNVLFFMYYIILSVFGKPEFMTTLVATLGFTLLLFSYVAFGLFASSLVENQIIAAILTIGYFVASVFLPELITGLTKLSPINAYFTSFANGTIQLSSLVLLLSNIVIFIIFTMMVIQRRKSVK